MSFAPTSLLSFILSIAVATSLNVMHDTGAYVHREGTGGWTNFTAEISLKYWVPLLKDLRIYLGYLTKPVLYLSSIIVSASVVLPSLVSLGLLFNLLSTQFRSPQKLNRSAVHLFF